MPIKMNYLRVYIPIKEIDPNQPHHIITETPYNITAIKKEGYFFAESELPASIKALLEISQIPQVKACLLKSETTEKYDHIVDAVKKLIEFYGHT